VIYLHTLGDCLIKVDEKEIRPTSPLLFAALLYLGMERGRRVPRAALQELFFPDASQRSGAHSVRQLLYKLRKLGNRVLIDPGGVAVQPEQVWDERTRIATLTAEECGRIRGGLLPHYEPEFSEQFSDWLEAQRSSSASELRRALVTRLAHSRTTAQWGDVELFAQALRGLDPLNEEAALALAECAAMVGSKVEAVRILNRYQTETGSNSPSLPAALLRTRVAERLVDRLDARTPFIGREDETRAIYESITRALRDRGGVFAVAGEPGIGKTRLIQEIQSLATLDGLNVFASRCKPHHSDRPFGVLIELIPSLLEAPGALGVSPESMQLLRGLSKPHRRQKDLPSDSRDDMTTQRLVRAAFHDLLESVAAETPTVLVVDDVQWIDKNSLRELCVATGDSGSRVAVLLSARSLEQDASSYLRDNEVVISRLGPLPMSAMTVLARRILATTPVSTDMETVVSATTSRARGNPLHLQMLCANYSSADGTPVIPTGLLSAITNRIEQLPVSARRALELMSLLGKHSTRRALRALIPGSSFSLLDAVRCLEDEGMIQLTTEQTYLSHDLVAECVIQRVKPATLALLHDSVARYLEAQYEESSDPSLLWDCADQWVRSGDAAKATHFLIRCANHALDIGQAVQAIEILQRAESMAQNSADLARVLEATVPAARARGYWRLAYESSERYRGLPASDQIKHGPLELIRIEAGWELGENILAEADELRGCLSAADAATDHRLEAGLLLLKVAHDYNQPSLARDAFRVLEPLCASETGFAARMAPLVYHTCFGDPTQASREIERCQSEMPSWPNISQRMRARSNVSLALNYLGMIQSSIDSHIHSYGEARRLGLVEWQLEAVNRLCWYYIECEDFDNAEQWLKRWNELLPQHEPTTRGMQQLIGARCELAMWRGDRREALRCYENLCSHDTTGSKRLEVYLAAFPIRLKQRFGDFDCDDHTLNYLRDTYFETRALHIGDVAIVALGEALYHRGAIEAAKHLVMTHVTQYRRGTGPFPPSLANLLERCEIGPLNAITSQ